MSRRSLIGVAVFISIALVVSVLLLAAWGPGPKSYPLGGNRYDCNNMGPYDKHVKDLQAQRKDREEQIKDRKAKATEADRAARVAKQAYDDAVRQGNLAKANAAWQAYLTAIGVRNDHLKEIGRLEREILKTENDLGNIGKDYRQACGCPPNHTGGQCR